MIFIRGLEDGYVPPESMLEFQKEWSNRENSHPDFQYSKKRLEEIQMGEKIRFELINRALNGENFSQCPKCRAWYEEYEEVAYCPKCGHQLIYGPKETERRKTVEILKDEEEKNRRLEKRKEESELYYNPQKESETIMLSKGFVVPSEVYANATYREYLDHADNLKSIRVIVDEYYRKYRTRKGLEKPEKKKHWWQH